MDEERHFKSFFVLFHRLNAICKKGGKGSYEANQIIGVMQFHYRNLNIKMIKFIESYAPQMIEMGYVFINEDGNPIFNNEEDKEAKIAGKFDFANLVHECKNASHPGQLPGAMFNYNEFSNSLKKISWEEYLQIKTKTINNIKFEEVCKNRPEIRNQYLAKHRQPRKWALPDSEKDWS